MALHRAGVPDEHRVPGSRESGRGSAGRSYRGLFFALAAAVGDGDGAADPDAIGQARRGYRAASSGAVPGRVPTLGTVGALVHG